MTFEDLEKKCNEWKKELDLQEESFLKRATQINAWDRLVTANSEKITELNEYMKKVTSIIAFSIMASAIKVACTEHTNMMIG